MGGQGNVPTNLSPGKRTGIRFIVGWPIWTGAENLAHTRIRSPERPDRSEWLYRLSYPGPLGLNVMKKLVKWKILSIAVYGAGTWTFRTVDQKYMEKFEMWCYIRMGKVSWADLVRN